MALLKFLDARTDCAFKRIFGTERNKDILIHFLNDILGFTGLQNVQFLAAILDFEIAAKEQGIFDVLCEDSQGSSYIIKMAFTKTKGFEKCVQYYAAKTYVNQIDIDKVDQEYHKLKKVIFITVADCIIFPNKNEYKSDHAILGKVTCKHYLNDFSFTFIELPKFPKTKEDQLENIVEKWCYFFRYAAETREEDLDKIVGSDVIIKRAYEEMNKLSWSEEELLAYEQEKKRLMDEIAANKI